MLQAVRFAVTKQTILRRSPRGRHSHCWSTVGFKADNTMGHPGYFSAYMTPASPSANFTSAGSGKTWFKIWEWSPSWSLVLDLCRFFESVFVSTVTGGVLSMTIDINQFTFTIPKNVQAGTIDLAHQVHCLTN
ncbi:hypothetical protein CPB85DRAFT_679170 [Mucidula mucida]|nr:hypothetical protein CPB85DRAFT_679170 [Mucidula mucida]